jgi:two-component system phosphate regulon sensor histidine kinase PhoR
MADKSALHRALQNIVTNAIKYSGSARWVGVSANATANGGGTSELQVRVQDKGSGITESDLSRIFEPFYRGRHASTIPSLQGTGLGLALAKQIVEAHGGKITVTSAVGQGSTFDIHLPLISHSESISPQHEQTDSVSRR